MAGNLSPGMRVVDAGCGGGRKVHYLLREGYEVFGVDADTDAVAGVRRMARAPAPGSPAENSRVAGVEGIPFEDEFADL